MVFLIASAGLVFASLLVPGYVRAAWTTAFVTVGIMCVVLAALTAWFGELSSAQASIIMLFGDIGVVIAVFSLADRDGAQVLGALLVLSTLFVAIFMRPVYSGVQLILVAVAATIIPILGSDQLAVQMLRCGIILVSVTCPAVFVLILRSQLDRAAHQALELATTDPLTGLVNRRGLEDRTPALLARASRCGTPVGVLVADVDHFKGINDTYGHAAGDEVLTLLAGILRDHVGRDDVITRLGGEEIAVVTIADMEEVVALAERLRAAVEDGARAWGVTVSIGVTCGATRTADDPELLWSLLDRADELMYDAKRAGRNQVKVGCGMPAPTPQSIP